MSGLLNSTIGRKYAMSLSAIFLVIFLVLHLSVNLLSVISVSAFNDASYFMGYNWVIQYIMQPILIVAVLFHFVMGIVLERKNKISRPIKYEVNNAAANTTWMSRNMIYSGLVILAFLALHMYDFWLHEMEYKYIPGSGDASNITRFWPELHQKFADLWRVILYIIAFVFLGLHLGHGFQSALQSVGARHPKYTPMAKAFGKWFAIIVPVGFIFIAFFHFLTQ